MDVEWVKREIGAVARFLRLMGLPRTAAAVDGFTPMAISQGDTGPWFESLVETYRGEIVDAKNILGERDPERRQRILGAMDSLICGTASTRNGLLRSLFCSRQALEAVGESHGNLRELYRSFASQAPTAKYSYLTLCLMYLILTEGVFANVGRLVLELHRAGSGEPGRSAHRLEELPLSLLVQELDKAELRVFTEGYERHIRNAIAHGHLRYDGGSDTMRFKDYDPGKGMQLRFDMGIPSREFARMYAKLDDTYRMVSTYFQIHLLPVLFLAAREMDSRQ